LLLARLSHIKEIIAANLVGATATDSKAIAA